MLAPLAALALALASVADSGVISAAPAAEAPGLVAEWRDLCATHRADFSGALKQADAEHWMVAPDAVVQAFARPPMGRPQVRLRSSAEGMRFLLVGVADMPPSGGQPGFKMRYCGMGQRPLDPATEAQVKAFAAVPVSTAFAQGAGTTAYIYRDGPNGREAIMTPPSDARTRQLLAGGQLNMILVKGGGDMSLVLFAVPTL